MDFCVPNELPWYGGQIQCDNGNAVTIDDRSERRAAARNVSRRARQRRTGRDQGRVKSPISVSEPALDAPGGRYGSSMKNCPTGFSCCGKRAILCSGRMGMRFCEAGGL
jgi:hypothetical protein